MPTLQVVLAFTALVNIALGLFVYLTKPGRPQNRQFFLFALNFSLWTASIGVVVSTGEAWVAESFIRIASYVAALIPITFLFLCMAISGHGNSLREISRGARLPIFFSQIAGLVCFTDLYMTGVEMVSTAPGKPAMAEPQYGIAFAAYNVYFPLLFGWIILRFVKGMRQAQGIQRTELQFVLLGMGVTVVFAITTNVVIPQVTGAFETQPLGPLGVIAMNAIVAYGMVTRKVMEVAVILRRIVAYALLTAYLVVIYQIVIFASSSALEVFGIPVGQWPALLAALAVAFSVAPAHGRLQRIANQLFINQPSVDVGDLVKRAGSTLQSISTVDELLPQFVEIVSGTLGTDQVTVLLDDQEGFAEVYPHLTEDNAVYILPSSALAKTLRLRSTPLVLETLKRQRLSPLMTEALESMTQLNAAAAVGVLSKGRLVGIMLLGPRVSGRVYAAHEESALQIICNELAIALENAQLFTETRNSRIYNDILLDNLGCGVVAVSLDHDITAFNRDAQRMLRMSSKDTLDRPIDVLPAPLARILKMTLTTGQRRQNEELTLTHPGSTEDMYLRVGCSTFNSHTGERSGALAVFHDVTHLKGLQNQIRRTDRLASMGTLSAGMAHEIKNPLVTIKTFTELLPERYTDTDFRDNFVTLVSHEVKRIDSLVNQLLTFSRPAKPTLTPINMHEVIDDSLRLIEQQYENSQIAICRDYGCSNDLVMGDDDLLGQAFVNFFLNAHDAMSAGGTLTISTSLVQNSRRVRSQTNGNGHRPSTSAILIRIQDTGLGINEENLERIFDPFFSTKNTGTGLGLAVSHGIIQEQGGLIDVESLPGEGTSFLIDFPLGQKEAKV